MIDTTDPRADYPPDQRFVNQGTDRRIPGKLGEQLALIQRLHSSKVDGPPAITVERLANGGLHEVQTWPDGKEHHAYAWPYGKGLWRTVRFGYRYDQHWGDANVKGYNPEPEKVGGRILDVVIKLRAREPFIEIPQ